MSAPRAGKDPGACDVVAQRLIEELSSQNQGVPMPGHTIIGMAAVLTGLYVGDQLSRIADAMDRTA